MLEVAYWIPFATTTAATTINDDANTIVIKLSNALIYRYLA